MTTTLATPAAVWPEERPDWAITMSTGKPSGGEVHTVFASGEVGELTAFVERSDTGMFEADRSGSGSVHVLEHGRAGIRLCPSENDDDMRNPAEARRLAAELLAAADLLEKLQKDEATALKINMSTAPASGVAAPDCWGFDIQWLDPSEESVLLVLKGTTVGRMVGLLRVDVQQRRLRVRPLAGMTGRDRKSLESLVDEMVDGSDTSWMPWAASPSGILCVQAGYVPKQSTRMLGALQAAGVELPQGEFSEPELEEAIQAALRSKSAAASAGSTK
jgi:hypothetical protein